jgi:PIN domain nuclease of toxin-antitoxin system
VRVLLDTVTFILAVQSPDRLSSKARQILQNTGDLRELSAISLTEIATKTTAGKLTFSREDVLQGIADLQLRLLSFTAQHALDLFRLPMHHRDPFDRQIIAQALAEDMPVVTCDQQFGLYKPLSIIW